MTDQNPRNQLVCVLDRYALGYPANAEENPETPSTAYVPLALALTGVFNWDAHITAYNLQDVPRRLAGVAALTLGPTMTMFIVDIDGPDHKCSPEWLATEVTKILALLEKHPGGYVFSTRGGLRVIYWLAVPMILQTIDDAASWTVSYDSWVTYLKTDFGIGADPSCNDFTRLYRLPRSTRDGVVQVPETLGDPSNIGAWSLPYITAVAQVHATAASPAITGGLTFDSVLESWCQGAVACGVIGDRYADVECPNADEHTDGKREARIFDHDGILGFKCLHAHCVDLRWQDFRRHHEPNWEPEPPPRLLEGFDEMVIEWCKQADATAPAPTKLEIDEHIKTAEAKWKTSRKPEQRVAATLLGRLRRGQPLSSDPSEDRDQAFAHAIRALILAAPPTTPTIVLVAYASVARPDIPHDVLLDGMDRMRVQMAQEKSSGPPEDEFEVETSGPRAGKPIVGSQHNADVALTRLGVTLHYDRFARRKLAERDGVRDVVDDDIINGMMFQIEQQFKFYPPKEKFFDYCTYRSKVDSFHPVCDYLARIQPSWDKKARCETWLIDFAEAEDTPYVRAISRLVLVAAVRRVRQPGCKFDEMLIIEGEQGTAKSSALQALCPDREWFADNFRLGDDTKKMIEQTSGKWIVEAGELGGMSTKDQNDLKAYLSSTVDEARMAYAREPQRLARQFVIIGSTNDAQYLKDPTGDRRYWPVTIKQFDLDKLLAARDQIWAEAAHLDLLYPSAAYIRLHPSLYEAAKIEQEKRRIDEPYQIILDEALNGLKGKIRVQDVWKIFGRGPEQPPTRAEQMHIASALQALGFKKAVQMENTVRSTYYMRGTEQEQKLVITVTGTHGMNMHAVMASPVRQHVN